MNRQRTAVVHGGGTAKKLQDDIGAEEQHEIFKGTIMRWNCYKNSVYLSYQSLVDLLNSSFADKPHQREISKTDPQQKKQKQRGRFLNKAGQAFSVELNRLFKKSGKRPNIKRTGERFLKEWNADHPDDRISLCNLLRQERANRHNRRWENPDQ